MARREEAESPSYVVVFPSIFARKRIPQLVANIKAVLTMRNQQFSSVARDGGIIRVHASDPVFASAAIGLLFGVSRVAIARRAGTDFEELVSRIASIGGNLLLRDDRFLVRVEGATKGFTAKDAEIAATSRIIEKRELQAVPGTEDGFDKELYAYVTRDNSYICIFSDGAMWGVPRGKGGGTAHCAVYDELSALACFECMRQGYDVSITAFYKRRPELLSVARLLNRLIPRMLRDEVELEFVRMKGGSGGGRGGGAHLARISAVTDIMTSRAAKGSRISLAVMPGVLPADISDALVTRVFERNMIPLVPLAGLGSGMYDVARELALSEAGIRRLEGEVTAAASATGALPDQGARTEYDVQSVSVRVGANNVHDILDALYPPAVAPPKRPSRS